MNWHLLGEKVELTTSSENLDPPVSYVNRVEVVRPDRTTLTQDWDRRVPRVTVDQVGIWWWRLYVREGDSTAIKTGQFEVIAADKVGKQPSGPKGRLARLLRR